MKYSALAVKLDPRWMLLKLGDVLTDCKFSLEDRVAGDSETGDE